MMRIYLSADEWRAMRDAQPLGWSLRTYREAIAWAQEHPDDPELSRLVGRDDQTLFILTPSQDFGGETSRPYLLWPLTTLRRP